MKSQNLYFIKKLMSI